jgi:hypothetical protein
MLEWPQIMVYQGTIIYLQTMYYTTTGPNEHYLFNLMPRTRKLFLIEIFTFYGMLLSSSLVILISNFKPLRSPVIYKAVNGGVVFYSLEDLKIYQIKREESDFIHFHEESYNQLVLSLTQLIVMLICIPMEKHDLWKCHDPLTLPLYVTLAFHACIITSLGLT